MDAATVSAYRDREFPVTRKLVHLNHAGVSPTSVRAAEAASRWLRALAENGDEEEAWEAGVERCRERFAALIGCRHHEVAFVRNTSHGLSLVAEGIDWQPGDALAVATAIEYPSNVHPWRRKARELRLELIELPHRDGMLDMEAAAAVLRRRPRLLAVSSAQFISGAVTDLEALGTLCREHGVLYCVDAIQTLGALPIDVRRAGIDFLTADGHKWLLGMPGAGVFFVDERRTCELRPALVGWKSMIGGWEFDSRYDTLLDNAGRFEEGSPSYALIEGLGAAVDLLSEISVEAVSERIGTLVERLAAGLGELGCRVGPPPGWRRHIVSYSHPALDSETIAAELARRRIMAAVRGGGVRIAPHFYNTEAEIDRVVAATRALLTPTRRRRRGRRSSGSDRPGDD